MTVETEQLVSRVQGGDRRALEELLRQHLPGLRAYVRLRAGGVLRERESASDLVQSACRDVLEQLDRFRYGGEAGFRDWLYATALRKIADRAEHWGAQMRDHRRDVPQADSAYGDEGERALLDVYRTIATPSQHAMAREAMEQIESAFEGLDDERREIIVLARIVGLSHAEIAAKLGCSEATARQRLFRALAELAEALGPARP